MNSNPEVAIFPNPNEGGFFIILPEFRNEVESIIITNILGEIVDQIPVTSSQNGDHSIYYSFPSKTSGIYFVTVRAGNYAVSRKVTVR
jgi:hypothetical protein